MMAYSVLLGALLAVQYQPVPVQPYQPAPLPGWVRQVPPMGSSHIPDWGPIPPLPPLVQPPPPPAPPVYVPWRP